MAATAGLPSGLRQEGAPATRNMPQLRVNDRARLDEKMRRRRAKSGGSSDIAEKADNTPLSRVYSGDVKLAPHVFVPFSQPRAEFPLVGKSRERRPSGVLSPTTSARSDSDPLAPKDTNNFDDVAASIFADADAVSAWRRVSAVGRGGNHVDDIVNTPRGIGGGGGGGRAESHENEGVTARSSTGVCETSSDIEDASSHLVPSPPVAWSNSVLEAAATSPGKEKASLAVEPTCSSAGERSPSSTASAAKAPFVPKLQLGSIVQAESPRTNASVTPQLAACVSPETPQKLAALTCPRSKPRTTGGEPLKQETKEFDDLAASIFADANAMRAWQRVQAVSEQRGRGCSDASSYEENAATPTFRLSRGMSDPLTPRRKSSGSVSPSPRTPRNSGFGNIGGLGVFGGPGQAGFVDGAFAEDHNECSDCEDDSPPASATGDRFFGRKTWFAGRSQAREDDSQNESDRGPQESGNASAKEKFGRWRRSLTSTAGDRPRSQGRRWSEFRARASLVGAVVANGATQGISQVARKTRASFSREESSASNASPKYPDAKKYIVDQTLWNVLEKDYTVLIKGSWLCKQAGSSNIEALPRRQDLVEKCPSAIWKADELFPLMANGSVMVIAVSHCWQTKDHPDPTGSQLRVLGHALGQMIDATAVEDLAVFYDWCSLYQRPRCQTQEAMYLMSREDVSMWFAHTGTRVWMLAWPSEESNLGFSVPYAGRGWTNFERAVGEMATQSRFLLDLGKLDSDQLLASNWQEISTICRSSRSPPVKPEAFEAFIRTKEFRDGEVDRAFVTQKYASVFFELIVAAQELSYSDLEWTDDEVRKLVDVLPCCTRLRTLVLHGNSIGEDGAVALAKVIPRCPSLKEIWLTGNPLSKHQEGKQRLRQAWASVGLPGEALHF